MYRMEVGNCLQYTEGPYSLVLHLMSSSKSMSTSSNKMALFKCTLGEVHSLQRHTKWVWSLESGPVLLYWHINSFDTRLVLVSIKGHSYFSYEFSINMLSHKGGLVLYNSDINAYIFGINTQIWIWYWY
jgi:hypothetical protein